MPSIIKISHLFRRFSNFSSRWLLAPPKLLPNNTERPRIARRPLLMVAQVQRSGGTLFSQLLDSHPELWVFPGEMHIAKPKSSWPTISQSQHPSIIFRKLVDHRCIEYARVGYSKSLRSSAKQPFNYDVDLHHSQFCAMFNESGPNSPREILDLFFTSFFATWQRRTCNKIAQDEPNYYCGFAAGFEADENAVMRYFSDYPDGHLVSLLRSPDNWLPSALKKETSRRKFHDVQKALGNWRKSAHAIERNLKLYPGRVTVIDFRSLILNTRSVMEEFCARAGLEFQEAVLKPSFDGLPIESNSSFEVAKGNIDTSVLLRRADPVNELHTCMDIYNSLLKFSVSR